jgi:hypothetical protein
MTQYWSKEVTTKKLQHCYGCARVFPKGSKLTKWSCVYEGAFNSGYQCQLCNDYQRSCPRDYWQDGYYLGDLRRDGWESYPDFYKTG